LFTIAVQSVFSWVTDNVRYDLNKYYDIKKRGGLKRNTKFKSETEYKSYLLKKGVCEDYALLFDSVLKQLGYESYIVTGYTKDVRGRVSGSVGHAWSAVKVNGEWKLYDPTWGAGYVQDGKKFVKKYNEKWYDANPEYMIKTHMPFDPVWQMMNTPLSYKNFDTNKENSSSDVNLDYKTLINEFIKKDKKLRM
jgi:transglutaminase/protease-like cytokinesis protein 3